MRTHLAWPLLLVLAGCEPTGALQTVPRDGDLGNGVFAFSCFDPVSCASGSTTKADFERVAVGGSFTVRFTPSDTARKVGKLEGLLPYFVRRIDVFVGQEPGYGTLVASDDKDAIIDFVTLRIVQPERLVVYGIDDTRRDRVAKVSLGALKAARYLVVSEAEGSILGGTIKTTTTSSNPLVATVTPDPFRRDAIEVRGNAVGTSTITLDGAGLTSALEVEVTP